MADRFLVPKVFQVPDEVPKPESLIKKIARAEELAKLRDDARKELSQKRKERRAAILKKSLDYEKEYDAARHSIIEAKREAKSKGGFYREPEPKVVFIIRLKGINKLAPKPKKVLQLFRLRQIHNGVFMKVNKATNEMLKLIHPFVTFGYPSLKMIRQLIYKRGYAKVGRLGTWSRKRILDNDIVAQNLGKYGIEGVEDIVHEIYTCGPHFREVNNFLWPFKLTSPKGGWTNKKRGFCDPKGGDWGNREDLINPLLSKMN